MKRAWLMLVLGLALGCGDGYIARVENEIVLAPPLTDLGEVPVGETVLFAVRVENIGGGDTEVRSVDLLNVGGAAFAYDGPTSLLVSRGEGVELQLTYTPPAAGYHRATLTVTSDSLEPSLEVEVRGRGVLPDATVSPLALEFGPVPVGGSRALAVTVWNASVAELALTEVVSTHPAFSRADSAPFAVQPSVQAQLPLVFTPTDEEPATGEVTLRFGSQLTLGPIFVRGNDCAGGLPPAYDQDGDGWTVCAGDCDDGDPAVRPGAPEVADGADQDCDGTIDEGTDAYDDDGDGLSEDDGDCNDGDPSVVPGATEDMGNGIDDDCDGVVDQGTTDLDVDGYAVLGGDCDDTEPTVFPGAPELPDGLDNDCDGSIDEGTSLVDDDGDGVSEAGGDCDDADPLVGPGMAEVPNYRDDDCDGDVDEGTIQADDDGDGFTEQGGDCDDGDPAVSPATPEVPSNGVDDDCDGAID
jgi:hypothetical protein